MKLLKKVVLPLLFVVLAATAMILVALAAFKGNMGGGVTITVKGITFGASQSIVTDGHTTVTNTLEGYKPSLMPLLGFIFIGVGLVAAALGLFLVKDEKIAKFVVLGAAVLVLVGGVFQFFALQSFARVTAEKSGVDYEDVIKSFKEQGAKIPLCTVGGVLGLVGGLVLACQALLPAKK